VPLKREGLPVKDTQGGEEPPAVEQPGLAGRKASLLDWHDMPVVEYIAMDHDGPLAAAAR
jgi:hypothetical protein